jgi:outer membrane protein
MMLDLLLEAALRATFIAAGVQAVLLLLRVRSADVRHRVLAVVMIAMLALPLSIAYTPDVSLRVLPASYSEVPGTVAPPADSFGVTVAPLTPVTSAAVAPATPWNWRAWLLAVYVAGAAVLLGRLAIGTVRVRLLAREATLVDGWLTSPRIATPFTFGLLKPRILLPQGWDRWSMTRLAVVLDHERTHVARLDPLVQWLALLNRAIFWFHPLAWWLERRLAELAEEACDAVVLARGHDPADYSEQLLDLARMAPRRSVPLVGTPMPGSALPTRITKILDGGTGRPASRTALAGAAALATLAATVLGTVTLAQEAASPRNLLEVYELAAANDAIVREAEAEYRAFADASPQAQSAIAEADYYAARQNLLIRVAEPYFGVFAAERALALQEAARDALSRQLQQTQRRFEVGLIEITDLVEAQARFDQAVVDALTAQRALDVAQETLREVVGERVGELRPLVEDLALAAPDPGNAEAWIATAMQRNPALIATRIRAETAGGAQRSVGEDLERVVRRTEAETRAAYRGVVSELARARALEQSVKSNRNAFAGTRAAFEVGTRSTADVLTAQINLSHAETAYALSRYDYALNVLRLRAAAGSLTGQELEAMRIWFE